MRLVDLKCDKCGHIIEDVNIDLNNAIICLCGEKMERIFGNLNFRIIKYSPEYKGNSNKNLINVPDALGNR